MPGPPQGPFTAAQLRSLVKNGLLDEDSTVRHPKHGSMPVHQVLLLLATSVLTSAGAGAGMAL